MFKRIWLGAFLIMSAVVGNAPCFSQPYLNPEFPVQVRVEDLLSRMTLEEKIGQMTQPDRAALTQESDIATFYLGSVLSGGGSAPAENSAKGWADMYDRFQAIALSTRLAIPLLYGVDAVHGHNNVKGAVIFPHNIGLGAARNPELVRKAAEITALEVAGTGIDWTFAPCVAVPRDERWGRTYEAFSEDPELTALLGRAAVKGFQGDSLGRPDRILACAKHFLGDGGTLGGKDQGDTQVDEATLRRIHLPGYVAAIQAGVGSVMASFNSWNGEKMHGNQGLLTGLLKNELEFKGFVVSDWAGIDQLPGDYHSDVVQSINAGLDMVMVPTDYRTFVRELIAAVNAKEIPMARIDDAVRRILAVKFQLGLFERPYTNRKLTAEVGSADHRKAARACVRESLVLLTKKEGVLPLSRSAKRIHVAGNGADNIGNQCGGWTISWQGADTVVTTGTTVLQALRAEAPGVTITYSLDGSGAAGADLAVAVIGETPYAEGQGDRQDLHLDADIVEPVRTMKKAGVKVVVVLLSGRPLIIDSILPYADAIIAAWLPGSEGSGVTDVLFGRFPFTGKLPHSWPAAMADVPLNRGDAVYRPLYPFGHGLTALQDPEAGAAPVVLGAAVEEDGRSLLLNLNKAMARTGNAADWQVQVNGQTVETTGVRRDRSDHSMIHVKVMRGLKKGDVVTVKYKGRDACSRDKGKLAPFAGQAVYNLLNDRH
ncbi:MAG TPA: glycoside hydrolase family 3 N-terminal domain-containing protein [bacterium]|nr:glycoside hydrolase family 3 N-terminal domain-containing protein [bacterium]